MAAQPYPYLILTDGTDTVTILDGAGGITNWPLASGGWAPAIGGLRSSQLGGLGLYGDVVEELTINLQNSSNSLAQAYTDLDTLTRLLDKADRWWRRGESLNAVTIQYVPQGSTVHSSSIGPILAAIVLGRADDDEVSAVRLPDDVTDTAVVAELASIRVRIMRRGSWTSASESNTSASAANPSVMTCTLPSTHQIPSPVDISIGGFTKASTPTINGGFLIVGSRSTDIQIVEAEGGATGAFTSQADAASNARGGNVLRYTPAVTTAVTCANITISNIGGAVAVLAAVRNNGTATFLVHANLGGLSTATVSTPDQLIDASSTSPRLITLGTTYGTGLTKLTVTVTASATALGTLDIDYFIVVNLADDTVSILATDSVALTNLSAGAASLDAVFVPTSYQQPIVQATGVGGSIPTSYRGVLPFLSKGQTVYVVWTATNGTSWRFTTTAPAVLGVTAQATRYKQFLSPQ